MARTVEELKHYVEDNLLDLSLSNISEVPVKEIAQLKKVTEIDLSSNHLVALTNDFAPLLRRIVVLDLSQNFLKALPGNFGQLASLQRLDLYKNCLVTLPVSFSQLKKLQWLDLKDNPLSAELQQVAGDCLDDRQCKQAASKVVEHMEKIHLQVIPKQHKDWSNKENMVQKPLEHAEKNTKKKSKEKRKSKSIDAQVIQPVTENRTGLGKTKKSKGDAKSGKRSGGTCSFCDSARTGCSKLIYFLLRVALLVGLVIAFSAVLFYVGCSEKLALIPQRKAVCGYLYERLMTSGDLLSSATSDRLKALKAGLDSCRKYMRDTGVENAIDNVFGFLTLLIANVSHFLSWFWFHLSAYLSYVWLSLPEWTENLYRFLESVAHFLYDCILYALNLSKRLVDDFVTNYPIYWEKIKFAWRNLK